jgi:hypothetical protein
MSAATTAPERWLAMMPPEAVRDELYAVYGVEVEGQRWAVATDGYTMIAERTQRDLPSSDRTIGNVLAREGDAVGTVPLDALVSFAGAVGWPTVAVCDSCGGRGEYRPRHRCDCAFCDRQRDDEVVSCIYCRGGRQAHEPGWRAAWIGPVALNLVLLAQALSAWPPPPETAISLTAVRHGGPAIRLDAGDVRVIIMGMVAERVSPDAPRLEMQEVAT